MWKNGKKEPTENYLFAMHADKPSFKNNSYFFSFTDGIRGRKEIDKSISYFLTAPKHRLISILKI
jgi:hypothetical protein